MPVLMLIAIAVVLVGIFFVATGRGGELAYEQADHAPLDLGPVSAADIALLRPPSAMWGYNMQVTDAALDQIARAMRERDVTIAYLQDQLASAQRNGAYAEPRGAHARPFAVSLPGPAGLEPAGDRGALALSEGQAALAPFEAQEPPEAREESYAPEESYASEEPYATEDPYDPEESYATEESYAPEELADPEPLEPLEASGSRTAEPSAVGYEAPEDSGFDSDGGYEAPRDDEPPAPAEAAPAEAAPAEARSVDARSVAAAPVAAMPADSRPVAETPTFTPAGTYRQTPLVLKASGPRLPAAPGPDEVTQPSVIRAAAEEPEAHDPTEPNPALSPQGAQTRGPGPAEDEVRGPQGSFNTHDWWAEQTEAAQEERARRQAAGETDLDTEEEAEESGHPDGDPLAAEEQGW